MDLRKAHRDIQKQRVIDGVLKKFEAELVGRVTSNCFSVCVTVLHDKFGFGSKRLENFIAYYNDTYDSLRKKYVSFEDLKGCLSEELKIDFDKVEEIFVEMHRKRSEGDFSV